MQLQMESTSRTLQVLHRDHAQQGRSSAAPVHERDMTLQKWHDKLRLAKLHMAQPAHGRDRRK